MQVRRKFPLTPLLMEPMIGIASHHAGLFKRRVQIELSEVHIDTGNRTFIFNCSDHEMNAFRLAMAAAPAHPRL